MKKLLIPIILIAILALVQFSGCTPVTKFEHYGIEEDWSEKEKREDGTWVYVPIHSSKNRKIIIPGIYDNDIYREPYRGYFTIWGYFDKIDKVEAFFILNESKKIKIPIDVTAMNSNKKKGHDGRPYFPAGKIPIDLEWDKIKNLKIVTVFTATKDGVTKNIKIINYYKPIRSEYTGNRLFLDLMSI